VSSDLIGERKRPFPAVLPVTVICLVTKYRGGGGDTNNVIQLKP
jgi:hypothetical protein